jgi:hypothetical protein
MLEFGGAEVWRGIVRSYDTSGSTATIELVGTVTAYVCGVPVASHVPSGDMVNGAKVAVVLFDGHNPADAVILGVYE